MQRNQDDIRLIEAIEAVIEPAKGCFGKKDADEYEKLSQRIKIAMDAHPSFQKGSECCSFGPIYLRITSNIQARNLLKIAVQRGAAASIDWCHKIFSVQQADLRYVAEVYRLTVDDRLKLSNGVALIPLKDLALTPNARAVQNQFHGMHEHWNPPAPTFPIGATYEVYNIPRNEGYGRNDQESTRSTAIQKLEKTIRAFTLVDKAAPVIGTSWLEFVDMDLNEADSDRIGIPPRWDAPLGTFNTAVDSNAIEWVERYLKISDALKPRYDIAIERLNLARRRSSPGDQAIDGGICLEALLCPETNTEINYRIRLRAALLLEDNLQDRKKISDTVKEFYNVRSKMVHGHVPTQKVLPKQSRHAAEGLNICSRVLQKLVMLNKEFIPEEWELTGGSPIDTSSKTKE